MTLRLFGEHGFDVAEQRHLAPGDTRRFLVDARSRRLRDVAWRSVPGCRVMSRLTRRCRGCPPPSCGITKRPRFPWDRWMRKPLVILSSARSGTNYFLSVFRALSPEAVVLREVFRSGGDSLAELETLTGRPRAELARLGQAEPLVLWGELRRGAGQRPLALKIFYYHAKPDSPIWDRIAAEARIVHLYRRRILDALISLKLAELTGQWMMPATAASSPARPTLTLDPDEVAAFIARRKNHVQSFRERFRGQDIHEVAYEDICEDTRHCARKVADLMGWPHANKPLELPIRKQNYWAARDVVSNYADVAVFDRLHL
jgi:hypothetical protein